MMPPPNRLLRIGLIGTVVSAVCCFTPALVVGLGALGLSAWLAWLDWVLLPSLLGFAVLTVIAWVLHKRATAAPVEEP